jgi:predicted amidohydrolase YtcJ
MTMPDDLKRVVDNGIVASIQGSFVPSDHSGNMVDNRVGPDRLKYVYTWRTMIDAGLKIVGGSDSPVEDVNPFRNMHAAVTRQFIDANVPEGDPNLPWQPQERITREEALKSYTIWGAYAVFGEKDRGSLTAGKYADFVVIDRDYFGNFPDADLQRIKVLETYVGGEKVYDAAENAVEVVSVHKTHSAFNLTQAQIRGAGGECPQCLQALASIRNRQKVKK